MNLSDLRSVVYIDSNTAVSVISVLAYKVLVRYMELRVVDPIMEPSFRDSQDVRVAFQHKQTYFVYCVIKGLNIQVKEFDTFYVLNVRR